MFRGTLTLLMLRNGRRDGSVGATGDREESKSPFCSVNASREFDRIGEGARCAFLAGLFNGLDDGGVGSASSLTVSVTEFELRCESEMSSRAVTSFVEFPV